MNLDMSIVAYGGVKQKYEVRILNSVDPDNYAYSAYPAHYEPSHLDLQCLHWIYVDQQG